ncbi:DUF1080 domain-containing protein [Spirosoma sp. KCTC 42546]|uniref:3-keto-disaccharide hydrolase n=1 Tax=Spirosoma sp. KCTC 42546 TaxID=2520506 RepID=UPI00115771A5|nr:DUF1080 domain-containing protein [Spirosoma sp. KCTC 42546]QDK80773.1 DUF1080 domain-containing protein [Spirosoma sp. KCTC 42546]
MKQLLRVLLICLSVQSAATAQTQKSAVRQEWVQLFNGKDLKNWDIKIAGLPLNDNYKNTFRVENGILRIAYDQYKTFDGKYGHMYYNKPYSYYRVRFTYRFVGNQTPGGDTWNVRNSGVMVHSQSAASCSIGQTFPVSLELQLLGGLGKGPRHTGNLCTPGTQVYMSGKLKPEHCIDSDSKTYDGDQWVTAEAIVLGDSIVHHIVEGDTVLTYERPEVGGGFVNEGHDWKIAHIDNADYWISRANTPLGEGYIALQAESHAIDFKKVEVLDLKGCTDPKALNYKSYFVKSDNTQCRYKKQ